MAPWITATRQVANMTRLLSSPKSFTNSQAAAFLLQRRGLTGGADRPPKVNFWEDPMSPSKWKKEHFLIVSLAGSGLLIYGGYKLYTDDKKDKKVLD